MPDWQKIYDALDSGPLAGLDDQAASDKCNGARDIWVPNPRPVTYATISKLIGPVQANAFIAWLDANSPVMKGAFANPFVTVDASSPAYQDGVAGALAGRVLTADEAGMLRDLGGGYINLGEQLGLHEVCTPELIAAVRAGWTEWQARVDEENDRHEATVEYLAQWAKDPTSVEVPATGDELVSLAVSVKAAKVVAEGVVTP